MSLSLTWTPVLGRGSGAVFHLAGNFVMFALAAIAVCRIERKPVTYSLLPCIFLFAAAALILIELSFRAPVRTMLGGGWEPYRMNRGAVAVVLFLPFALYHLPATFLARGVGILTVGLIGWAAFVSESESAKLTFLLLPFAFLVSRALGRAAIPFFCIGILATLLLMPLAAYNLSSFLPVYISEKVGNGTVGMRADMWSEFCRLIWQKPLLGHAMESSYVAMQQYGGSDKHGYLLGGAHPHNFAIQVWYELGAVGVLLFSVLTVMYFRALRFVPDKFLPAILSTTAAVWTVSLVSHGAWQAWWWSFVGLLALLWVIVLRADAANEASTTQHQAAD
ncbi:MAG: O-antigen ligase family protein [Hyphomicrobiales bacterium]